MNDRGVWSVGTLLAATVVLGACIGAARAFTGHDREHLDGTSRIARAAAAARATIRESNTRSAR